MTRTPSLCRLGAVLALLLTVWALPVLAQSVNSAEVEKLVSTLEDAKARQHLIAQLKLLQKAQAQGAPEAEAETAQAAPNAAPVLLTAIPDKIEESVWSMLERWGGGPPSSCRAASVPRSSAALFRSDRPW